MPLYLYYGDESYLLQREVKHLREQVVDPAMAALSYKVLKNPSIGDVMEAIGTVSFSLGGNTLIEIQEWSVLEKATGHDGDKKMLEELKGLLETLEPSKYVLFVNKKIDRKVSFPKWLASFKAATVRDFKKLEFWKTDEAVHLMVQEAKAQQIPLSREAAGLLVETMGMDLQTLMNEVQKLSLYAAGRTITPTDVMTLSNHNENTFQMLGDWVQGRNRAELFHTLEELLLRQHPVQLFALIQSYLNNLFRLRLWRENGLSEQEIADRLKKHPFKVKKDLQECAGIPFQRLATLKDLTLQLEWKSKTGQLNDRLALEILMGA